MATTTRKVWVPGETGNHDGPMTTTFIPDDYCSEVHYLRVFPTPGGADLVSFMPYDAYHPEDMEMAPTCGPRTSRNGCYPPGDWNGPTFSPGLYCPRGWTTASVSEPGLIFDGDPVHPWCNFPAESTRVAMTVDCTLTAFAIGPTETTTITLVDYQNRSEFVAPASNVVLFGGAVAVALVGNAATTMSSSTGLEGAALETGGRSSSLSLGEQGEASFSPSAKIGTAVGATVGGLLLLALGFLLLRRYRRRRLGDGARAPELDSGPAAAELGSPVYWEKEANSKPPPTELPANRQHAELGGSAPRVYEME
ncbi:hypothetical protein DL765_000368 [Monosporascus sp. GIB2]|nr:hypothetical protein DL765_000368 [Monosporascus sp. GIB2]